MPIEKGRETGLAAGANSGNVLAGSQHEYLQHSAVVSFYAAADQTDVLANITADSLDLARDAIPNAEATAGVVNRETDGMVLEEVLQAGTRLNFDFTAGAAAAAIGWLVTIDYIPGT